MLEVNLFAASPPAEREVPIQNRQPKSQLGPYVDPAAGNTCAIFVTFFPDARFVERLARVRNQVSRTIIVDNTPDAGAAKFLEDLVSGDLLLLRNPENLGIGAALNEGFARAAELGCAWAVTFDQDSWADADLVETLRETVRQQPRPKLVGMVGCQYQEERIRPPSRVQSTGARFAEVAVVITSGSLLSLRNFTDAGPFRADFFIDSVDHEYCLRLRRLGYKVLQVTAPLMVHALGDPTTLGSSRLILTQRSPLRRYYMTRNGLLVAKEYFTFAPLWSLRSVLSLFFFALLKIPFEKTERWNKFCATLYGAFDALRGKTGKA